MVMKSVWRKSWTFVAFVDLSFLDALFLNSLEKCIPMNTTVTLECLVHRQLRLKEIQHGFVSSVKNLLISMNSAISTDLTLYPKKAPKALLVVKERTLETSLPQILAGVTVLLRRTHRKSGSIRTAFAGQVEYTSSARLSRTWRKSWGIRGLV